MAHQIKAAEAHVLAGGFKRDYFDACYRRIEAYARRGSECCSLKHAPDPETEQELIRKLRDDGYKVYENALLVGWYCPDHPLNKRPSSAPVRPSQSNSICDAYDARVEVNSHRVNYVAEQYGKISKAARRGETWCQLDHSPDSQLEGLLCELLKQDGYEVHADKMIATWI
ncbi:Uncharacterised protein [Slackia heliotrinireducens]|uniref:Uncharacterized protein n=1 Tax=Slackia heliotrinireducens (strain ATCC 29202 / DSM 20476 / NCTC 11029 / RHS 1) TaxID=471855 RepID=C7N800_SLAHD|nr:hypothetical protein [Slackia heliotrinireducens]ACV23035.1 hypothetical protein Shel_20210 [Slackia heliotrinireducens DSM 20476]VEH01959.1 Uncharacterised protein [Slackia heliotrinireducens]